MEKRKIINVSGRLASAFNKSNRGINTFKQAMPENQQKSKDEKPNLCFCNLFINNKL